MASFTTSSRAALYIPSATRPSFFRSSLPPLSPHCVTLSTLRRSQIHRFCSSEITMFIGRQSLIAALAVSREAPPAPPASNVAVTELQEFVQTAQQAETTGTKETGFGDENVSGTGMSKTLQWDKIDDKYAVASLGIAAVIALWTSIGLISAIDRIPLLSGVIELVGIGYSGWFAYRNLIFKPDREELLTKISEVYGDIVGHSDQHK